MERATDDERATMAQAASVCRDGRRSPWRWCRAGESIWPLLMPWVLFGLLALVPLDRAVAQQPGVPQRVFLPTWHVFRSGGTYLVPDRGRLNVGGVRHRRSASRRTGLPGLGTPFTRNRSTGRSMAGRNAGVHATIHDLRAIDEAIRKGSSSGQAGRADVIARQARQAVRVDDTDGAGALSLAEIRRRRALRTARRQRSARSPHTGSAR